MSFHVKSKDPDERGTQWKSIIGICLAIVVATSIFAALASALISNGLGGLSLVRERPPEYGVPASASAPESATP